MLRTALLLLAAPLALACSDPVVSPNSQADAQDAAQDAVSDTSSDALTDAEVDAAVDGALDTAHDASALDAAVDAAADAKVDAPADSWQPGVVCGSGAGGKGCPAGQTCYAPPCPKCGIPPAGTCTPDLPIDGCYDYTACAKGVCASAKPLEGVSGFCLPWPAAGACWPHASAALPVCYPGFTCEGASVCAPNAACAQPSQAGTCKADPGHTGQVILWARNGNMVGPNESVTVTWINATAASIFLPGCSTYDVETSKGGAAWKNLGPPVVCAWEGYAVEVKAGAYFDTHAWSAPNSVDGSSFRFSGSYSTGCVAGKPLSQAACTGSATTASEAFSVGLPP